MTLRIGQKVCCVKDFGGVNSYGITAPALGMVYTIREFENRGTEPSLRLVEIVNEPMRWSNVTGLVECGFATRHFRPVVEKKAEISFTANAPKDSEKWDNRKRVKVRA